MRDIRARISRRHGIDLTTQQIQELASRRLEAILEPRHVKPALMEQMRRAAGEPIEVPPPAHRPSSSDVRRGCALPVSSRDRAAAAPFAESDTEAVLQSGAARGCPERPGQTRTTPPPSVRRSCMRVRQNGTRCTTRSCSGSSPKSLERRSRRRASRCESSRSPPKSISTTVACAAWSRSPTSRRRRGRQPDQPTSDAPVAAAPEGAPVASEGTSESSRRRRRRRRGRRSGPLTPEGAVAGVAGGRPAAAVEADVDIEGEGDSADLDEGETEDVVTGTAEGSGSTSLEPADAFSLLQPVERHPRSTRRRPIPLSPRLLRHQHPRRPHSRPRRATSRFRPHRSITRTQGRPTGDHERARRLALQLVVRVGRVEGCLSFGNHERCLQRRSWRS